MGLDDCPTLRQPQPSHQVRGGPRQWSLVSPMPFLDLLWEDIWGKVGVESLVTINLPRISKKHVVSHILPDRGEVDTCRDAKSRQLCWIANPGEHEKLRSVEHSCTQDDLFAGGNSPSLTLHSVNKRMCMILVSRTYQRVQFRTRLR